PPPVTPPPPAPPPTAREEEPPHPSAPRGRTIDLGAFAQTSSFGFDRAWLAGGGLRVDYADRRFCAGLDLALLTRTEDFELGTAQTLLVYGSPYVAWRERWGPLQTRLGGGWALGAARVSGHATDPAAFSGTTTGPWTAPYAFVGLRFAVT